MMVKVICAREQQELEDAINAFLNSMAGQLEDIKFSADDGWMNVIIIYKKN